MHLRNSISLLKALKQHGDPPILGCSGLSCFRRRAQAWTQRLFQALGLLGFQALRLSAGGSADAPQRNCVLRTLHGGEGMVTADSSGYPTYSYQSLHLCILSEHTLQPFISRFTSYPNVDTEYHAIPSTGIAPDAFHVTLILFTLPNCPVTFPAHQTRLFSLLHPRRDPHRFSTTL